MLGTILATFHSAMNRKRAPNRTVLQAGVFHRFARVGARAAGHPIGFGIAISTIVIWAVLGFVFHFSDTWQLVINTATTIVTFLMVFLIQNSQNRDSEAIQLKLDEIIRSTKSAHNALLDIEELSESELDQIKVGYERLAKDALAEVRAGKSDLGCPEVEKETEGRKKTHK
jgi:low affinity Fe/Cu permease